MQKSLFLITVLLFSPYCLDKDAKYTLIIDRKVYWKGVSDKIFLTSTFSLDFYITDHLLSQTVAVSTSNKQTIPVCKYPRVCLSYKQSNLSL